MKRTLRTAAALAFLTLGSAAGSAALAQTPPGVLVVGQIAEPKSLDPHAVTAVNDFRILMNVYDGLVRYKDGTLEVEPALAESWTISDDGTTYTFGGSEAARVYRGADRFHDASECAFTTAWHVTRLEDPNGNQLEIEYAKTGNTPLPSRIFVVSIAAAVRIAIAS